MLNSSILKKKEFSKEKITFSDIEQRIKQVGLDFLLYLLSELQRDLLNLRNLTLFQFQIQLFHSSSLLLLMMEEVQSRDTDFTLIVVMTLHLALLRSPRILDL